SRSNGPASPSWVELPGLNHGAAHRIFAGRGPRGMLDQTQASANQLLAPYLPRLLADWVADSPEDLLREVDGTVAFVDISGFTKLSERLAKQGKVGAEELADAINTCFT